MDLNNNGKDDIQEIADGIRAFVADEKALIAKDVSEAAVWLNGILAGLTIKAQAFVSAAIDRAKKESESLEETATNTLNILYHDSIAKAAGLEQSVIDEVKALPSDAISAALGLTSPPKAS